MYINALQRRQVVTGTGLSEALRGNWGPAAFADLHMSNLKSLPPLLSHLFVLLGHLFSHEVDHAPLMKFWCPLEIEIERIYNLKKVHISQNSLGKERGIPENDLSFVIWRKGQMRGKQQWLAKAEGWSPSLMSSLISCFLFTAHLAYSLRGDKPLQLTFCIVEDEGQPFPG